MSRSVYFLVVWCKARRLLNNLKHFYKENFLTTLRNVFLPNPVKKKKRNSKKLATVKIMASGQWGWIENITPNRIDNI